MRNVIQYPINEIFATLQGEATFAGTPSVFIRMQGCDVGCAWCDTKHTWQLNPEYKSDFIKISKKTQDKNEWAYASLDELINYIQDNYPQITHIVITGGEPAQYDLNALCERLEKLGKNIQIETSGTELLKVTAKTWVTLSPKINMPGGKVVLKNAVKQANEIKMPIGKMSDIEKLKQFILDFKIDSKIPIWLQPLSQNPSATQLCIDQAMLNNWRLSIQVHKYLNIR